MALLQQVFLPASQNRRALFMSRLLHFSKFPVLVLLMALVVGLLVTYAAQEAGAQSPASDSNESCINCHTDQEQLQATAEEEVETESLSEGEG
jgi:nitrate/TMAO reductase-like tetraheme cytochrome c subunit